MLHFLIHRAIARQERFLGVSLDYLRDLAQTSKAALLKLALIAPLGAHRRRLPREAFHLARLGATMTADCGACVQIALNVARQEGVSVELLEAALDQRLEELPPDYAEVFRFAQAIAQGQDDPERREALEKCYGHEGLVEVAIAIAVSGVFPTLKRALGHAVSCSIARPRLPTPVRSGG